MTIFLDCDGVINQLQGNFHIDNNCVKIIAELVKVCNADLVLISTWRLGFLHDIKRCTPQIINLRKTLQSYGVDIKSRTKKLSNRYEEICEYLERTGETKYLILDDDKKEYIGVVDNNIYFVDGNIGITKADKKRIMKCI